MQDPEEAKGGFPLQKKTPTHGETKGTSPTQEIEGRGGTQNPSRREEELEEENAQLKLALRKIKIVLAGLSWKLNPQIISEEPPLVFLCWKNRDRAGRGRGRQGFTADGWNGS